MRRWVLPPRFMLATGPMTIQTSTTGCGRRANKALRLNDYRTRASNANQAFWQKVADSAEYPPFFSLDLCTSSR